MKTRPRSLSVTSIAAGAMAVALGGSIAPPQPPKHVKPPEERVESSRARKNRRRNKGHSATAEAYRVHRCTPAGRSSTLKKTAKLYRLMGWSPAPLPEDIARHHHPRHERAAVVAATGRRVPPPHRRPSP